MRFVGERVARVEDPRLLTGRGKFVDDVTLPRMLHAAFVRSPMAHARINSIDTAAARAVPGVAAVFTGADLEAGCNPLTGLRSVPNWPTFRALPTDKARFVGDPLVMVVAASRYLAEDACELVDIDYEPLPAVTGYETALDPASPAVFDELGDNIVVTSPPVTLGDIDAAFAEADQVVRATLRQHRVANVPLETRGGIADYDPASGELTFIASTQTPHGLRQALAQALDHPLERLRVLAGDVGGGFGLKGVVGREDFCMALASKRLGRPVKWVEDRNEHLLASGHAREEKIDAELALKADGTLLGLRVKLVLDGGAYPAVPFSCAIYPEMICTSLPGPYHIKAYEYESTVIASNKATYVAYRGPWEMEVWTRERLLDIAAHELGLDPADLRRRNLVAGEPGDQIITGRGLEGITSRHSLEQALDLVDYDGFRKEQAAARAAGRYLGIGFAIFMEAAPGPPELRGKGAPFGGEQAKAALQADGHLLVTTGQAPHGQGHETTLAQVAADQMGLPLDHVRVVHGDTRQTPFNLIGTGGSRAGTWATGAVIVTTRRLREKVLDIAAHRLRIDPGDLDIVDGMVTPKGAPDKAIPLADVAKLAMMAPMLLPPGTDVSLTAQERFDGSAVTSSGWSGGAHVCTVEADLATGQVRILRYVVVEDCGRVVNPAIVEGQICGGIAQGIGEVLYENAAYDADGNFLAATFMDYLLPTAAEIPHIEIEHIDSAGLGDFDFHGVGEGGALAAPATLTNAVADALLPFGARVVDQYLPPAKILELAGVISA
ncbi:xanthine dehydrogenase family protein molybdopterin-binding subunit [Parafrankia discariae]|uniref:xanthine dehydrogenase family protein molybdopterin-binding subunit n=1 Tax=Parafrankia discariae TaxID=365528 RepID=UPI0003A0C1DB|nr:xanthine dehydrogenase family protein molybdopterin-binding subunit [Parafrankia discariae]